MRDLLPIDPILFDPVILMCFLLLVFFIVSYVCRANRHLYSAGEGQNPKPWESGSAQNFTFSHGLGYGDTYLVDDIYGRYVLIDLYLRLS